MCVCVHVHACKSSLFCFTFICFFLVQNCVHFYVLFNCMIIVKLKHIINMERVITCVSCIYLIVFLNA